MSVCTPEELALLKAAGRVVARTLRDLRARVRPGISTAELDEQADRLFAAAGARSGPRLDHGRLGTVCISVDDEGVHGVPGPRRLREGELVKLDVTTELDGFHADACRIVAVGRARPGALRLRAAAEAALRRGMQAATAGAPINHIGRAAQGEVQRRGFAVGTELTRHGSGAPLVLTA
ncbi:M24 family metallopeptidase [Baekduia soli]|uniref:M24 family metallopeptidase n=1 Tax=Baekduia soli TaxID=496014 RepID=A0A5B8UA73_9ACTN|nr:M24 family metallopeptidase [Baekduia soli]QEC49572.1 M24 family metallopeptidase [Baekduia soli]